MPKNSNENKFRQFGTRHTFELRGNETQLYTRIDNEEFQHPQFYLCCHVTSTEIEHKTYESFKRLRINR